MKNRICYSHPNHEYREGTTMGRLMIGAKYVGLACLLAVLGCKATPPSASTQAVDEAAVRQTDEDWSKAAQSKQVDPWVAYYADDAVLLPPNEAKAIGKDNIRKEIGLSWGCLVSLSAGSRKGSKYLSRVILRTPRVPTNSAPPML